MVFPTVSYSAKINNKFTSNKKVRPPHPKMGPRHAPNIHDRIAAYDRAFQRCLKQDSKLSSWKKRMDEKGLPTPLIEGYQRSSSSWQHSLSSMSSDSTTSSNESYTMHGTKNVYDIKPMKSMPTTLPFPPPPPPPLSPPMPKPSVSRRIINRLSLSKSTKRQSSKVVPITTQSVPRANNTNNNGQQQCHCSSQRQHFVKPRSPKPSLPRTSHLQPQKRSSVTTPPGQHSSLKSTKDHYQSIGMPQPSSPPSSPCDIDDYFYQKSNRGSVEYLQYPSLHHYHRHRTIAK